MSMVVSVKEVYSLISITIFVLIFVQTQLMEQTAFALNVLPIVKIVWLIHFNYPIYYVSVVMMDTVVINARSVIQLVTKFVIVYHVSCKMNNKDVLNVLHSMH
jgi:hypothetical protein